MNYLISVLATLLAVPFALAAFAIGLTIVATVLLLLILLVAFAIPAVIAAVLALTAYNAAEAELNPSTPAK